jgi:hypothetical protein|tara:strand:+ start:689 stop:916 length:228 start_codon:yes stop_codon:yes gene_type:complete
MALKTFNIDHDVHKEFADHCKAHGISMSKRIENFIKLELQNLKQEQKPAAPSLPEHPPTTLSLPQPDDHPLGKYC